MINDQAKSTSYEPDQPIAYVMIKPSGARYLLEIEHEIEQHSMHIISIYCVGNWSALLEQIHKIQFDTLGEKFYAEFVHHTWLNNYLFGNDALVLLLESKSQHDLQHDVLQARVIRNKVRQLFDASMNGTFTILVNSARISELVCGFHGVVGVHDTTSGFSAISPDFPTGFWDYHYLNYVHAPGDIAELEYEWNVLISSKIISEANFVTNRTWQVMKQTRSLIPGSMY